MPQSSFQFQRVAEPDFVRTEHDVLRFWKHRQIFDALRAKIAGKPAWSFLDGPITANNPMGVHHAWGRTYKDCYQRFFAMTGHDLRYQNGFDCQGLWVEVEVEKELGLATKTAINAFGIDQFVNACKQRVLKFAARQTEQSIRLGYWMEWDDPEQLRKLAAAMGSDEPVTYETPRRQTITAPAHQVAARLGNPEWGGSYFTFSTENNETIWAFLKKCAERGKIYQGYDVMPWSGRSGSAYSQMEVADGRQLTTHRALFVRFPLVEKSAEGAQQYLLVWTTTPWTLTSNVAAAVNPELEYVKLQSKRDGAIYYFAKDNLEFKRLEREFKEGFGRPDWSWPASVPKLKSIAQIFKEQGGFDILGTLRGAELVGWTYAGPFDDLPAQSAPGGVPEDERLRDRNGISCHRVIDGGRDSKGNANVVAGEGTGIVHIAPGCGDIDHKIGTELGLVHIAPLGPDGRFQAGFGDFTGRAAIDASTVDLVIERLKSAGCLVSVESYPHIYPHCWRTGDELVFRLVDEWFIDMDWRDEIKAVTRSIRWLPDSIDGQNREVEWLTIMRDWMISKKRFWGLALPIWVDPETDEFEVIGSLAELQERAVEGWEEVAQNTPHRPWIDRVKLRNPRTGNLMHRVEDVGNPWLDAGIVPFSTLAYNTDRALWNKWFPADLVTECFPGQFRNWFYSLLSLATMMQHEKSDPLEKRPFKTLLGHRLVLNEEGKAMHKSDGTAIWFEEAAEQLGVDTLRWLYLAQNPAADLRFGTRHKDQPVTLQTPEGPISATKEGLATCLVTSKPADEIRRQFLIPLWHSYAFFVNYARLDQFDPRAPAVPVAERAQIDRWILSRLQSLIGRAHAEFPQYNVAGFVQAAGAFIDDLSNWYIRRSRKRFWRSQSANDQDKQAAYQTLYDVLLTLSQLLAPVTPFLAESMYQNLAHGRSVDEATAATAAAASTQSLPASVHLCDFPQVNAAWLDEDLNAKTAAAQKVVQLGHKVRESINQRVRQPLAEIRVVTPSPLAGTAVTELADVIADELNIKQVSLVENLDGIVGYTYKPNLKTLGPRYGKLLKAISDAFATLPAATFSPLRRGQDVTLSLAGGDVTLSLADVMISTEQASDWGSADDAGYQVAISTTLTQDLQDEGVARDFVRHVQQARKDLDLNIEDRIVIEFATSAIEVARAVATWQEYIQRETLADGLSEKAVVSGAYARCGDYEFNVQIERIKMSVSRDDEDQDAEAVEGALNNFINQLPVRLGSINSQFSLEEFDQHFKSRVFESWIENDHFRYMDVDGTVLLQITLRGQYSRFESGQLPRQLDMSVRCLIDELNKLFEGRQVLYDFDGIQRQVRIEEFQDIRNVSILLRGMIRRA